MVHLPGRSLRRPVETPQRAGRRWTPSPADSLRRQRGSWQRDLRAKWRARRRSRRHAGRRPSRLRST